MLLNVFEFLLCFFGEDPDLGRPFDTVDLLGAERHTGQDRHQHRAHFSRSNISAERAVANAGVHHLFDSLTPVTIHVIEDLLHFGIPFAAQCKLLHHQQHVWLMLEIEPDVGKLLPQPVEGGEA